MSKGRNTTQSKRNSNGGGDESSFDLRKGPWTLEEDNLLIHYITCNGEGRWNSLAKCAGLKRTGKSCRLRWLNYLKPDIKRGNLNPQEQLLILELHSKWGNRWSKIAQHLPGRTDNEIKNYWRTRVQKQARQLNVDSNSKKFLEAIKCYWMPRLLEKMEQTSSLSSSSISSICTTDNNYESKPTSLLTNQAPLALSSSSPQAPLEYYNPIKEDDCYHVDMTRNHDGEEGFSHKNQLPPVMSAAGTESQDMNLSECQISEADNWFNDDLPAGSFWNMDELWHFRKSEVGF
ncbi:hypothetical protein ACH5RR_030163 [Cinchona calisaya]|uniref:Uncharacterized protein n=1 Tax=Cinchona calisaya TaxID=153742 RepID=A0ABD2YTU6_9GENT